MNEIIQNFQLIRPLLLLGLVPVVIIYVLKLKFGRQQNLWQQLLPQHLYQQMVISKGLQKNSRYIHYALFAWMIAVIAVAGPTWEKLPQTVYQTQAGKVILMDMSMSMRATDLAPNRLTRSRFKAIDLINQVKEGETGLVAYAGDAFVISPLTDDANTLISLIPSLRPEIMPSQGSSALSGLEIAADLLRNAGYQSGQIYWLTDGILYDEVTDIRQFIQNSNYAVSALLVGTENGAPIQLENGKLLKDNQGSIVVPSINSRYLNQAMSGTDGTYSIFASDNSDIAAIKRKVEFEQQQQAQEVENTSGDIYKDMGPYLLLLVLPFAAYAFRRGLLAFGLVCIIAMPPKPAFAMQAQTGSPNAGNIEQNENKAGDLPSSGQPSFKVSNWFKNADQKGKQAFDNENYNRANELFEDPEWLAASAYKKGDFQQALDGYEQLSGLENTYNKANALAQLGQLEDALKTYDEVIDADANHANAIKNKAIVEALLKQQQEQEQQNSESGDDGSDKQQSDEESASKDQEGDESDSEQSQSDSQDSESENGEPSDGEQQESDADDSNSENAENESPEQQKQDEDLKRQAQQQAEQEGQESQEQQQSQDTQANQDEPQQVPEDQQQEAISADQFAMQNLTAEQKEEMQRMQMIMNKVPDDPAYLLQRKMMLEAYKRDRLPPPSQENW